MRFLRYCTALAVTLTLTVLSLVSPSAQTSMTSTTLSTLLNDTGNTVVLASATGVSVGTYLVVEREAMVVRAINGTTATVTRGFAGTAARAHNSGALVYVGPAAAFSQAAEPAGACTRSAQPYLPRVFLPSGNVYDCPVGATPIWTLLNGEGLRTARSEAFNLDNGAGTTIDAVLIRSPREIFITACRIVYEDATTGTVAAGNARVGTTVGGSEIVASTAYANTSAVGTTTAMVVVEGKVAAATPVLVRHTGVGVTQAGEAVVECDYIYR